MKNTMGFLKSEKQGEKRIAILPKDLKPIKNVGQLYFESGYGKDLGFDDDLYLANGCHVDKKKNVLKCDILCDPKIGEARWIKDLTTSKVLFGWLHGGATPQLRKDIRKQHHICYAWEDMYKNGRHVFFRNNQLAGAGGVLHALQYSGWLPYGKQAAILGRGDVGMGACAILGKLGANVQVYKRNQEKLFQMEVRDKDIVVMAIRWDNQRRDHILTKEIISHMKQDVIIIDVSADCNGAIEGSHPTSIAQPIYRLYDRMIYGVNNIPAIFYKSATESISPIIATYIDDLVEEKNNAILAMCEYTTQRLDKMDEEQA